MRNNLACFGCVALLVLCDTVFAHINPKLSSISNVRENVSLRNDCAQATQQIEMSINNVRATLLNGGDMWWNLNDGGYVVPNVDPAYIPPVSSIFAGAVWIGGFDDVGNLKLAAQTYRDPLRTDFWPGPLTNVGTTEHNTCAQWDRFFRVLGSDISAHIQAYYESVRSGTPLDCDAIPEDIKGWPAKGNPYFFEINGWSLPFDAQGLGAFYDADLDELYDPCQGDYPSLEMRGCGDVHYPDEMIFWIYNDAGNVHTQSQGDPVRIEVQVQAFAYATNDEINNMTFQRYKLINRATSILDSCYFALWVDPDLGCPDDDYIGCDTIRDLMYVYNEDTIDGTNGCSCGGVNTYCDEIPMLGIDYFRGPRGPMPFCDTVPLSWIISENIVFISSDVIYQDSLRIICGEKRVELGMSSFTYYNNGSIGNWPNAQTDPQSGAPLEFYRYLSGSWKDGSPFCYGGSGYHVGPGCNRIKYAFPDPPSDVSGWSMSTAELAYGDRRTIQATGPMRLDPGEVNEIIIGAVWVPDIAHPNPDVARLFSADAYAQSMFDQCFDRHHTIGPDAPDMDIIEVSRELVLILSNDETSNNAQEGYNEIGSGIPSTETNNRYVFEGYKVYQFSGPDVSIVEKEDVSKSRLIYQCDVRNGVSTIYNWNSIADPDPLETEPIWLPELKVQGADQGIRSTIHITEDQFAIGDKRLVDYRRYYFTVVAYAYNNYTPFDPETGIGQRTPYIEGRNNIQTYTGIPRPVIYSKPGSGYGQEPFVTRLSGLGAGGAFLDITETSREAIYLGTNNDEVVYQPGKGPIDVKVFDPLIIKNECFLIEFFDSGGNSSVLDQNAYWKLYPENDPSDVIVSKHSIQQPYEQMIDPYGFSVTIGQTDDVGDNADTTNGTIGVEIAYLDPDGPDWLFWFPEGSDEFGDLVAPVFDFIKPSPFDPGNAFTTMMTGFYPFHICDYLMIQPVENPFGFVVTPGWLNNAAGLLQSQGAVILNQLNNVDLILTKDKSKWSRCIIVETANTYFTDIGAPLVTQGGSKNMERRNVPSVTKEDNDGDGLPDVDAAETNNGLGWFPGYAIDVESGKRLNIFFGENSIYRDEIQEVIPSYPANGDDMMFNPSDDVVAAGGIGLPTDFPMGGMHYVYVTLQPYDECASLVTDLRPGGSSFNKIRALTNVTWTGIPVAIGDAMLSYQDGLIPNDMIIKIRVDNPYQKSQHMVTGEYQYPKYKVCFDDLRPDPTETPKEIDTTMSMIHIVPNPSFAHDSYQTTTISNTVKITNLPDHCTVSIYSIDGRLIRAYRSNETDFMQRPGRANQLIEAGQAIHDIEWDLKNVEGSSIPAGVYLVHIYAPGFGERVIKWIGINL